MAASGRTSCLPARTGSSLLLPNLDGIVRVLFPMKSDLLELIRVELRSRLERLAKAAMDAHAAATDPGSKAESKYDTRSLE